MSARAGVMGGVLALAAGFGGGCTESGLLGNPRISLCAGPANSSCVNLDEPGTPIASITQSGVPGQDSFFDVTIRNLGELNTDVLNVYLAEGTNPYVTLEWRDSDPTGGGQYTSGEPVRSCIPDPSRVSDPALLPPAASGTTGCVFPLSLEGVTTAGAIAERRFRLRYTYDVSMVPNSDPVLLVLHFDYDEDRSAPGGVRVLEIPVEGCVGVATVAPTSVTFNATYPNTETQQLCVYNTGCDELTLESISFLNPVAGDVFTFEGAPPENTTIPAPSAQDDENAQRCFVVRYKPPIGNPPASNLVQIKTNDPVSPVREVALATGQGCPYEYELQHSDLVDFGKTYIDFSGIEPPGTSQRFITLRNTGTCPITLRTLRFADGKDMVTQGGPFYAEIRRQGETAGWVGAPGQGQHPQVVLPNADDTLDVVLTYSPQENVVYKPTQLILEMRSGNGVNFVDSLLIQPGEPRADLVMAPKAGTGAFLQMSANEGDSMERTVALVNRGLAPVVLEGAEITGAGAGEFSLVDDGDAVVAGVFLATEIPALGILPVTVRYTATNGMFNADAVLTVYTDQHPQGGAGTNPHTVVLKGIGYFGEQSMPALPVASFGIPSGQLEVQAGEQVSLSGGSSTGGDTSLLAQGYAFWLTGKPPGSAALLDSQGAGGILFTPDLPGAYEIRLAVFGQVQEGPTLHSEEAILRIDAQ